MREPRFTQLKRICAVAVCGALLGLAPIHAGAQEGRKVISNPKPTFPDMAKTLGLKGAVKVQVIIGTDGTIKETKVIGGHPILVESVKEALGKWKYVPSNTETVLTLEFEFHP
ncbi:MAG TPA: energy transducer TonB [Methylomirabilota bacterium]|nr:energy transducer TonB [Methylomirabilota bacterium]